jgi:transketolase
MSSEAVSLARSLSGLRELGQQLRVDSIRAGGVTKSGHPTSSMSAADLMAVLFGRYLRYDFDQPENPLNDHLIFSKGHAAIDSAFADAVAGDGRPTVIVAKTIKGKGVVALEDREGWHGKALADPEAPAEPLPEAPAEAAAEAPQQEEVQSE